jgi:hypothetical protein
VYRSLQFQKRGQLFIRAQATRFPLRSHSFFASDTTNRIRNALPIVPFTFRDKWIQRFEYFLPADLSYKLLKLALNIASHLCAKVWRNFGVSRASRNFRDFYLARFA